MGAKLVLIRTVIVSIVLTAALSLQAQLYVSPIVGLGLHSVNNENLDLNYYHQLKNNLGSSYFIGFEFDIGLNNRLSLKLNSKVEKVYAQLTGIIINNPPVLGELLFTFQSKIYQRIYSGIGMSYLLFDKFEVFGKLNYLSNLDVYYKFNKDSPDIVSGTNGFSDGSSGKKSLAFDLGLTYFMSSNWNFSLSFQQETLLIQDASYEHRLTPLSSILVHIGYRFKILEKVKKKSEINCPKF